MNTASTETLPPLTLAAAAKLSSVSEVTLRKHLKAGRLEANRVRGQYGDTWAIAPEALAAFVFAQYGRRLTLSPIALQDGARQKTRSTESAEALQALRRQLDETLVELGRYRALAAAAEDASTRVEAELKARLAELAHERDAERERAEAVQAEAAAQAAELARLRSRGFWARLFGGAG